MCRYMLPYIQYFAIIFYAWEYFHVLCALVLHLTVLKLVENIVLKNNIQQYCNNIIFIATLRLFHANLPVCVTVRCFEQAAPTCQNTGTKYSVQ